MTCRWTTRLLFLILTAGAAVAGRPFDEPPLEPLVRVIDPSSGAELSLDELVKQLARADVVFLGETHLDETTHRLEQELYRRLIEARRGRVVLAMEMFSRDAQGVLDDYLAGKIDEARFLAEARPWSNYRTGYRPLIETAKARGLPVVASNSARAAQRKVAMGGEAAFRELTEEERSGIAAELFPPTDAYWRRVENATRGHRGMLPTAGARTWSTQSIWDNTMGESIVRALEAHPGWLVLHVNGGFHSARNDGTARQVALRAPKAKMQTVALTPVLSPGAVEPGRWAPSADWQAYVAARASDANEGFFSVSVGGELRYALHVPKTASAAAPVPLLIWLPDDGPPAADELALWRRRLGDEAAIVVVEQQWREQQEDLSLGGRWTWPADFREDVMRAGSTVEAIWAFVARHQPVDPKRVVVAGEGVGATVAVAAHLHGDQWSGTAIALAPRKQGGLRDLPLPFPEDRLGPAPQRELIVLPPSADRAWWDQESADYREVGLAARVEPWPEDPWARADRPESAIRQALGLPAIPGEAAARAHVLLEHATPLARNWARRVATAHRERTGASTAVIPRSEAASLRPALGGSTELPTRATAASFADGTRLPRATGPFGGTTLVVLGDDLSRAEAQAWKKLEQDDPIHAKSRFHRLRTASLSGERSLGVVLSELHAKRRSNVLIVPAAFAAGPEAMRAIRAAARAHEDDMTLEFRPGLGAGLAVEPAGDDGAS